MTFDVIRAIEACYGPAGDDQAWLGGLVDVLAPLDLGCGIVARIKGREAAEGRAARAMLMKGRTPAWLAAVQRAEGLAPAAWRSSFFRPWPPVRRARANAAWLGPAAEALVRTALAAEGVDDVWGILAGGPGEALLDIGIPFRGKSRLGPRTIHQLRLLSAHLTTALRLRDRVSGEEVAPGDVEAVLEPGGRLCHAEAGAREPAARERLAEAVRRVERARGTLRRASPEEAAGLWTGLVDGRWSLLDSCEADGRRLVLARRNEPRLEDPRALTDPERTVLRHAALGHSNKYVAYLLGVAPSTVATHLAAARRKLGLRTRRDLIALGTALGGP